MLLQNSVKAIQQPQQEPLPSVLTQPTSPVQIPAQRPPAPVHTDIELAKLAGVGKDTIQKGRKIEAQAPEPIKAQLRTGEISILELRPPGVMSPKT